MALKKATEAKAPAESPAAAAPAAVEPVIETPVPVDSGEAAQTPALQPDQPAALVEEPVSAEPAAPVEEPAATPAEVEVSVAAILETAAPAPVAEEKKEAFVEVTNLRKTAFHQPSTNLWIFVGETKYLANDGWLENHVKANLLALVEED